MPGFLLGSISARSHRATAALRSYRQVSNRVWRVLFLITTLLGVGYGLFSRDGYLAMSSMGASQREKEFIAYCYEFDFSTKVLFALWGATIINAPVLAVFFLTKRSENRG